MRTQRKNLLEGLLLAERDRAARELRSFAEDLAQAGSVSGGDLARVEWEAGDASSNLQEEEADGIMASRATARLSKIDRALELLATDPDAIERCERCGRLIEPGRLEMVPWRRTCASCARANGRMDAAMG